jgi:hypothetical protein
VKLKYGQVSAMRLVMELVEKSRLAIFVVLIILFPAVCIVHAQQTTNFPRRKQKPSLNVTEKWITQTSGEWSHIVHKSFQSIDFDSSDKTQCHMHFMVMEQVGAHIRFLQLVNLADIDPTSIKVSEVIHDTDITTVKKPDQIDYSTYAVKDHPYVFVSIKTTDDKDSVIGDTYLTENDERLPFPSTAHEIGFPGEGIAVEKDYAPRVVSAFRHAVEFCKGKPSTF